MTQYKVLQSYKKIATPSRLPPKAIARQFFDYQFIFCNSLKSIHRNTLSSCEKIVFLLFCMEVGNASIGPAMGCIRVLRLEVLFPNGKIARWREEAEWNSFQESRFLVRKGLLSGKQHKTGNVLGIHPPRFV